jgi:hypothetical protein
MRGGDGEAEVVWGQAFTGVFGTETREQKVKSANGTRNQGAFLRNFEVLYNKSCYIR